MSRGRSTVVSMRLPNRSGVRLKKMARRHGWTVSDTSDRLVESTDYFRLTSKYRTKSPLGFGRRCTSVPIASVDPFESRRLAGFSDRELLVVEAYELGMTRVTFDLKTIPAVL